jgi:murein DD-endopeptidase MepM/ murein hydrolase activator NlpD
MQNLPVQGVLLHTDLLVSRTPDRLQTQLQAARRGDAGERDSALKKASCEFESIFIAYLLKVMRDTIEESGLTEGGLGKGIYTELFDQEVSRGMAEHGALGIADLVYKQLSARIPDPGTATDSSRAPSMVTPRSEKETATVPGADVPDFNLPLRAPVSSKFGIRTDPFTRRPGIHKGIDLAAPVGTEVRAAKGGVVLSAGPDRGFGNSVVIQHTEGYQTRYAHLGSISVKAGETVEDEQPLGTVGSTGHSTGPHLHFEVIRYGVQINPGVAPAAE